MPHACWVAKNLAVEPRQYRVLVNKENSQNSQMSLVLQDDAAPEKNLEASNR